MSASNSLPHQILPSDTISIGVIYATLPGANRSGFGRRWSVGLPPTLFSCAHGWSSTHVSSFTLRRCTAHGWIKWSSGSPSCNVKRLQAPNFDDLHHLEQKLGAFIAEWNQEAAPFNWNKKSFEKTLAMVDAILKAT
jgi:hypothetical protein